MEKLRYAAQDHYHTYDEVDDPAAMCARAVSVQSSDRVVYNTYKESEKSMVNLCLFFQELMRCCG